MKPNWQAELKTLKGEVIKDHEQKPVTLQDISYNWLIAHIPSEQNSREVKAKNYKIADKVLRQEEISIDEAKIILDIVGKFDSPSVLGAVEKLLDPKEE